MKYINVALATLFVSVAAWATDHPSKKLYESKCASCHGKDLKGNPAMGKVFKAPETAMSLIDEETVKKTDAELVDVTTKGHGKMPAYAKSLKPEEIAGLVQYIRSMGPKTDK